MLRPRATTSSPPSVRAAALSPPPDSGCALNLLSIDAQCHHFYDTDAAPGFDVVGETRCAQEAADACAAAGESIRLHAGMFAGLDLAGLGKDAEAVIEVTIFLPVPGLPPPLFGF